MGQTFLSVRTNRQKCLFHRAMKQRLNGESEWNVAAYVFAGGGTGGHLFPGIAVARELLNRAPGARIVFVGSDRLIERQILAAERFEHRILPVESFRTARQHPLRFLQRNWMALRQAKHLLRELQPDAVIGLGSFISMPTVLAASRCGMPIILLEQNSLPGRATRWLSRHADVIGVPSEEAARAFRSGQTVRITGNPVRPEIAALHARRKDNESKRCLLILGGSQGADSLNAAVLHAVAALRNELHDWQILHQAGPRQADMVRWTYGTLNLAATVEPFFSDLPRRYQAATVVISRAGATTLAELACIGCPAILVPFPHAAEQHQLTNARTFLNAGAARVVEETSEVGQTGARLAEHLRSLVTEAGVRDMMRTAMRDLARPNAAPTIADILLNRCVTDAA